MASNCKKTDRKKALELARRQAEGSTRIEGYKITPERRRRAQELFKLRKKAASGS
jgi:hypothetical protein